MTWGWQLVNIQGAHTRSERSGDSHSSCGLHGPMVLEGDLVFCSTPGKAGDLQVPFSIPTLWQSSPPPTAPTALLQPTCPLWALTQCCPSRASKLELTSVPAEQARPSKGPALGPQRLPPTSCLFLLSPPSRSLSTPPLPLVYRASWSPSFPSGCFLERSQSDYVMCHFLPLPFRLQVSHKGTRIVPLSTYDNEKTSRRHQPNGSISAFLLLLSSPR